MKAELTTYELRERERLFHKVFENSPDAIFIEDLEGNVLDVNPAACKLHGLSHQELVGKNVSELVPFEQRESMADTAELIDGEVEGYSLAKDGTKVPVAIRSSAISYMGRMAILLHVRDITERRRIELALRDSEERYRLLFDCNPQPMWVYDVRTRRFIAVNDAAQRLYRYSQDEFLGMESIDAISAQPEPQAADLPNSPNIVQVSTERHRRKDGTSLTVETTQHTIVLDNRLASFVMISKVISAGR